MIVGAGIWGMKGDDNGSGVTTNCNVRNNFGLGGGGFNGTLRLVANVADGE